MTLFRYVIHGDSHRHIKDGCSPGTFAMLGAEAAWPACPKCRDLMLDSLRRERLVAPAKAGPVRCISCAAWVYPGRPCGTCGATTAVAQEPAVLY